MHDLTIRTIVSFLPIEGDNFTIRNLMCVNKRFHNIKSIFIENMFVFVYDGTWEYQYWMSKILQELIPSYKINKFAAYQLSEIELLALQNMKSITSIILTDCQSLINLKDLSKVTSIELSRCNALNDVSGLTETKKITIHHCRNLVDVSPLKHIKTIILDFCFRVRNISTLGSGSVSDLTIRICPHVDNIIGLHTIKKLRLENLRICNVASLNNGKVKQLTIIKCPFIVDIDFLKNIPKLDVSKFR